MNRLIYSLSIMLILTSPVTASAQIQGSITYEVKLNMHRNLPADRPEMKNMIPEFRLVQDILVFNSTESLYKPVIEDEEEQFENANGRRLRLARPENQTYVNQQTRKRILLQDFMGKKFLIEDSLNVTPWKIGSQTKQIGGYPCKQATFYNEQNKQSVVAWYTEKLRPYLGPDEFNTLPGAVLQVDVNNGERLITAKTIDLRALKKNELVVPREGTKTTQAGFAKMIEEHMNRIRSAGGDVMIRN
ncbi:MAG TPA: GLPGLI family protein [Chryseosolibacter sp.]